jgi:predicted membrane-bound dolichyl-phosphate-mannose-protein mannosyltransferase
MASDLFQFSKCKGRLRTLTKLEIVDGKIKNIKDGMYKVNITSNDNRFKKIFGFSRKNVYTHTSIFFAMYCIREEGYDVKIELVNEKNNCYIYDKEDIVNGCSVFSYWH